MGLMASLMDANESFATGNRAYRDKLHQLVSRKEARILPEDLGGQDSRTERLCPRACPIARSQNSGLGPCNWQTGVGFPGFDGMSIVVRIY
ncbi:MAG: hypothetical protein ACLPVO_19665 [Desulfomonilaceae bacterium]